MGTFLKAGELESRMVRSLHVIAQQLEDNGFPRRRARRMAAFLVLGEGVLGLKAESAQTNIAKGATDGEA